MAIRIAFYPGSFDPPTNGHVDVIQHASRMVDKLIVGVGINPTKTPIFKGQERLEMLNAICSDIKTCVVETVIFDDLLIKAAKRHDANFIIRGIRDGTDLDYEMQMAGMNATLEPDVLTIFIPASPLTRIISATMVRQIASLKGNVENFAPKIVTDRLRVKFPII